MLIVFLEPTAALRSQGEPLDDNQHYTSRLTVVESAKDYAFPKLAALVSPIWSLSMEEYTSQESRPIESPK